MNKTFGRYGFSVTGSPLFIWALAVLACLVLSSPVGASVIWEGRDWVGADFSPANGDTISGTHINIGSFLISQGSTIYAGAPKVSLQANDASIEGAFLGEVSLSRLEITADRSLTIAGTIEQWQFISLGAATAEIDGSLVMSSTPLISSSPLFTIERTLPGVTTVLTAAGGRIVLNGSSASGPSAPSGGLILSSGGNILISNSGSWVLSTTSQDSIHDRLILSGPLPTPLPPSLFLFASGLAAGSLGLRWRPRGRY